MKKLFLWLFILLDVSLIAGSAYVLMLYLQNKKPMSRSSAATASVAARAASPAGAIAASTITVAVSSTVAPVPVQAMGDAAHRKILFKYRNPKARQVAIRADFTGWKAEAMQKDGAGNWSYTASLTAGEYAYCYTVDDKTFKDPSNKRTKLIGRTQVSAIVVEPLASNAVK